MRPAFIVPVVAIAMLTVTGCGTQREQPSAERRQLCETAVECSVRRAESRRTYRVASAGGTATGHAQPSVDYLSFGI